MKKSLGLLLLSVLFFTGCSRDPAMTAEKPSAPQSAQPAVAHNPHQLPERPASNASADLQGAWVEPIPGQSEQKQGFVLHADGSAASINMATLRYTHWHADAATLRLVGESIGNGVSSTFEDTYQIVSVDQRQLVLMGASGQRWTLARSTEP